MIEHPGNRGFSRLVVMFCSILVLLANAARADDRTNQALRGEGTWSTDCAISNVFREGTKAMLARLHNRIPPLGQPTQTAELIYEKGVNAGTTAKFIFTITNAKIVSDNKITITMVSEKDKSVYESVRSMFDGKMVTLRSNTSGTATLNLPAGVISVKPLKAGQHYSYLSAENGIALTASGEPKGLAILEKCRD